jgi:glycosyltransferase involved in cell wall biosynthesis
MGRDKIGAMNAHSTGTTENEMLIILGILRNPILIWLSLVLERFLYRRADRLPVNLPGFIDQLESRGAKKSKVVLIRNAVDPAMFDPTSEGAEFRAQPGLEEKFVALYAGAHGMSNNLTVLLDAADLLRNDTRIRFLLVGDGKKKPGLVLRTTEKKLDNVVFLPPVAKHDMAEVLDVCDCGIAILEPIPLYGTTYPNKVFDYLAAGRPVVLAIDGVIRRVVEDAHAGLAVPSGNSQAPFVIGYHPGPENYSRFFRAEMRPHRADRGSRHRAVPNRGRILRRHSCAHPARALPPRQGCRVGDFLSNRVVEKFRIPRKAIRSNSRRILCHRR